MIWDKFIINFKGKKSIQVLKMKLCNIDKNAV